MPDFILFLHRQAGTPPSLTPDQIMAMVKEYSSWSDRMRREGRFKAGDKLTDDAGRVMRAKSGRISVTDGPYAESKELVGGYYIISAKDYDEACRVAESNPHFKYGGNIEVRQVDAMGR
jgi:hypothetical protein